MFTDDFDAATALASVHCPRCKAIGIVAIDSFAYENTPEADQYQAKYFVSPSIPARCPSCALVMELPGCCDGERPVEEQ